ncbi:hypothetical protein Dda_7941 [Drechslerella dactyloides]|uniref:DNA mismatch repair protein PMS1 n=1 Tax=Drechslerella dactyloides TaxID=74499 RepID=A0AAD6IRF8_DREDA|nr:hypothetical protein Dda_7941 [Drechslerella dactyloides]
MLMCFRFDPRRAKPTRIWSHSSVEHHDARKLAFTLAMAEIKAIEGRSVHQIQSGQVISDGLCSAVKELVENSIDAHATAIEIRFKNHGLDLIEVSDNGAGITPDNFDKLALKHYTSKLRTYEDLERVTTYGFRGEALSSLCALSTLSVSTATADVAPKGSKIEFHVSGVLKGTSVVSHPKGTTVSVETLFKNLPVRRQEMERNIKREFARVVSFLQAYAIVCVGVKFTVYNHPPNGKKTLLFSTKANKTTKENIANVFGAKALANLIPLDLDFEMTAPASILHRNRDDARNVKIIGHISRPVVGEGRQAPDRQLFFVNSRPCNLPQVARAVNEVYKSFNLTQSPFVFADLQLDTTAYDVNVSPDKRTILLHDQANLLESLKVSLTQLFDNQDQTVPAATQSRLPLFKPAAADPGKTSASRRLNQQESDGEDEAADGPEPSAAEAPPLPQSSDSTAEPEPRTDGSASATSKSHSDDLSTRSNSQTTSTPKKNDRPGSANGSANGSASKASLTYEQKGKIAKAFASRQPPHMDVDEDIPGTLSAHSDTPGIDDEDDAEDDDEIIRHPLSQASPRNWRRTSPHPTTITIGDKTITSTPKRSPSKVFPGISSSSPTSRVARRNPKNTFAKRLQGFGASGTQSSLSVPEDIGEDDEDEDEDDEESEGEFRELSTPRQRPTQEEVGEPGEEEEEEDPRDDISEDRTPRPGVTRPQKETQAPDAESSRDDEIEIDPPEERPRIVVSSAGLFRSSQIVVPPSSPPPRHRVEEPDAPDEGAAPNLDHADRQRSDRDRHRVSGAIPRAEGVFKTPTAPSQARPTAFVKNDFKDSTHCLVQHLRACTIDNIRTLSTSLRPLESNPRNSKGKGKRGRAKLVKFDSQEEKTAVEERLSLTIAKSDFGKMRIAGQFNLGFILATRQSEKPQEEDANDLFIIDQHASDEKYNFERLQAETVVQNQPLVRPKVLELSAMDELVVMDNMDVLKKNGFVVEVDDAGDVGRRCRLVSLPMSKDKVFDLKDFEELLHLIREHPSDSSVRPSKVRAMFAMRACKSSITIGKALGPKDMKRVVKHMGELDKPWNCPHGRPTMRHLCDVGQLETWREDRERAFADVEEAAEVAVVPQVGSAEDDVDDDDDVYHDVEQEGDEMDEDE